MQIWIYLILLAWLETFNEAKALSTEKHIPHQPSSASGTQLIIPTMLSTSLNVNPSATKSLMVSPGSSSLESATSMKSTSSTNQPIPEKEISTYASTTPLSEREVTPKGESEPETEPEGETKSETAAEPETWGEPGPEWEKAFKLWKAAWPIHVYLFATAFLFIGIYAGYYVVLNIYDGLGRKYLSVCLNAMVLLFGMTRALVLFFDPYHQGDLIDALFFMRLLWSIGGPCLTASDSLIILALVETARVSVAPPMFQKLRTISIVIAIHFVLVVVADTLVSFYMEAKLMILLCQVFFSVWGITLGSGYVRLAYILDKKLFSHKVEKDKADKIYVYLIYASGAANFFICGVMIYTMVSVFGVYTDITFVDAWHWLTLQTLFRSGEVATCVLIFTVSAKRTRIKAAVDEISEFDTRSQISDTSPGFSAFRKLRTFCNRFMDRGNVVDISNLGYGAENLTTITKVHSNDDTISNGDKSAIPFKASHARGRERRQSLFSHMQKTAIDNKISQLEEAPAVVPSGRRKRRQSLFSAMHEASIDSAISNFANSLSQTNGNIVSRTQVSEEDCNAGHKEPTASTRGFPRRERRTNVFSVRQETMLEKASNRQAVMEDIKEESVYERESETIHRPSLAKKRSSERLRQIVSSMFPSIGGNRIGSHADPNHISEVDEKDISCADSESNHTELQ
ncbi:uncharacterized protein LOC114956442 isoform X1 [Acropora millepora]|uniref:uncharacterized protein LOC114956442 isoform X1 n=1 Tax=Acropora millepora TaxID=45264 RepID=UPI001CF5E7BE|nr:uncharacterized protein LOC114956442 isoform X1 [Acropora millepora]XP_044178967.1 uncharacterized protein LOC114956442 isoform X1 [Acropora millepora]